MVERKSYAAYVEEHVSSKRSNSSHWWKGWKTKQFTSVISHYHIAVDIIRINDIVNVLIWNIVSMEMIEDIPMEIVDPFKGRYVYLDSKGDYMSLRKRKWVPWTVSLQFLDISVPLSLFFCHSYVSPRLVFNIIL